MSLDQVVGPKGNVEFTNLVKVMGCNIGPKFDRNALNYTKIIIASDADVDGYFIRSLLLAFFFKMFLPLVEDGVIYIAEPPLYRVDDKKNPFVINKSDYIDRYAKAASKEYKVGYMEGTDDLVIRWLKHEQLFEMLSDTANYVDQMISLSKHYKVNPRLLEIIFEEIAFNGYTLGEDPVSVLKKLNIQHLMILIQKEFPELYFDDDRQLIMGVVDVVQHMLEINEGLIRRGSQLIDLIGKWGSYDDQKIILREIKTGIEHQLSLLDVLKILRKYQPTILHRFKGLGENDDDDIKTTIMDPNTRTLIRVKVEDLEKDMKIFQLLRGNTQADAQGRKLMMRDYQIDRSLIDT